MALSRKDGTVIMGMLARGDDQHDIAAWFGENFGRVADVSSGRMFGVLAAAPAAELPPKGAIGPKGRRLRAYVRDALDALNKGDTQTAIKELGDGAAQFDKHEA